MNIIDICWKKKFGQYIMKVAGMGSYGGDMHRKIVIIFGTIIISVLACSCNTEDSPDPAGPANNLPEITTLSANPDVIGPSGSVTLVCLATDPDGDDLDYVWEVVFGSITGSGQSVTWQAPDSIGIFTINCTVQDGNGGEDIRQIEIEVEYQIPTDGLVAWWPFNGNAFDESGNGINATVAGPVLVPDRHGNNNSAYSFDGQNDYMEADASNLPKAERTISIWFYANTVDNRPGVLGYGGGTTRGTSFFMGLNVNGRKSYHMSCHWLINRIDYIYTAPPVEAWYHWVLTTDSSGTTIYVNGIEEESNSTFVNNTYVTGTEIGIGVIANTRGVVPYTDSNVKYFNGSLDDIRIYNRALSEIEIEVLYRENE